MSQRTSVAVSRASQVHQIPQATRPQREPVAIPKKQKTTPISAEETATASAFNENSGDRLRVTRYAMGQKGFFQMLTLHTQGFWLWPWSFRSFNSSVEGAAPRLFRPMYAGANMGHPSREEGFVFPQPQHSPMNFPWIAFHYCCARDRDQSDVPLFPLAQPSNLRQKVIPFR